MQVFLVIIASILLYSHWSGRVAMTLHQENISRHMKCDYPYHLYTTCRIETARIKKKIDIM